MNHENTRIHIKSLELIAISTKVIKGLPAGHGDLKNQLRRASASVALNFAEGCGYASLKERARYFRTARASANEVSMIFDVVHAFGDMDIDDLKRGKDVCDHLGAMLFKFR